MRASSFIFAAVAGVAVGFVGTPGANAMTSTSPAGVRVATEAMDTSALVHCRSYRHWHRWEHRWTHGCHGGVGVEADVVIRRGHRVRVHEGVSTRTTVRSGTTTRGETSVRGSTSTKSGTSTGASTTTKSGGTSGATTGRGQGGEKSSTGGSSGGGMSGSSGGTSGGQKQ